MTMTDRPPHESPVVIIPSDAQLSINQEVVSAKIEALFVRGLDVAMDLLNSNIASLQLPIARTILVAATKLLGQDNKSANLEVRRQLDQLWSDMRATIHAPEPDSAPPTVDDPDEEPGA